MSKPNAFFVDTNFLINISQDNPLVYPFLDVDIFISYITEIELLGVLVLVNQFELTNKI